MQKKNRKESGRTGCILMTISFARSWMQCPNHPYEVEIVLQVQQDPRHM
jgi:hypothetical protein